MFYVGINHAEKIIDEIKEMLLSDKQFAVLRPTGLISEIARKDDVNGVPTYDQRIENLVFGLSKIVLSQSNDTWLLKLRDAVKTTDVLLTESIGCELEMVAEIMTESMYALMLESEDLIDWGQHNQEIEEYIETRRMRREGAIKVAKEVPLTSQPKAGVRRLGMTSSKSGK